MSGVVKLKYLGRGRRRLLDGLTDSFDVEERGYTQDRNFVSIFGEASFHVSVSVISLDPSNSNDVTSSGSRTMISMDFGLLLVTIAICSYLLY